MLSSLEIPEGMSQQTLKRWISSGKRPLGESAPYTAYVLEAEVFFQIAPASKLISSERSSNRLDIAYLFYLPICLSAYLHDVCIQRPTPPALCIPVSASQPRIRLGARLEGKPHSD